MTSKKPIHIHNDLHNSALLGLNDVTQIAKTDYLSKDDLNFLIKPNSTAINNSYTFNNAKNIINKSDIIVIYGMSLGATDKQLWELVGKWLGNRKFVKNQFLNHLELDSSERNEIENRIFISINSNQMFNDVSIKRTVHT